MNIKLKSVFVCIKSFKDNIWTLHVILSLHFPSKMRHNYEAKCKSSHTVYQKGKNQKSEYFM